MSYVLHAWEAPPAENVQRASALVMGPGRSSCVPSARLASFAAALRETYPDSHGLEAQGLDGESSAWSDSPLQPAPGAAVFAFGLARTDANFMRFIAHAAADHGLHVLDMQAAALYRPDRHVVFADGRPTALPRPDPEGAPPPQPPVRTPDYGRARRAIMEGLLPRLSPLGFRALDFASPGFCGIARSHGAIRQGVIFVLLPDEKSDSLRLAVNFAFGCDAIRAFLDEAEPAWRQHVPRHSNDATFDVTVSMRDIFSADAVRAFGPSERAELALGQVEGWIGRFCGWFEEFAVARLDTARDLAGLNQLLHNPARAAIVTRGMPWWPEVLFATLAILHLGRHPAVETESWLGHVRAQMDRNQLGQALRAHAARGEVHAVLQKSLEAALAMNRLADRIRGVPATP